MNTYWQIAAGSRGRDYANLFLKYGMAFVGGNTQIATMNGIQEGDVLILKSGLQKILAAGTVVKRDNKFKGCGDKSWLRDFDGWDLQAYCYVDWRVTEQPIETSGLTRATIQRVHQNKHKAIADSLLSEGSVNPTEPEPKETNEIEDTAILKFLIKEGLRPSSAEVLTNTISRIRLLADYYYHNCSWADIREHETRTFLVVPLLLALGWAEQQLKIELPCDIGRVDIACFPRIYRRQNDECTVLIETKDFSSGLDYAQSQARGYSREFPNCRVVVVTNGYCYKTYLRNESGDFSTQPSAYLNLLKPRSRYPLDPVKVSGALDAIKWLIPNNMA